MKNRTLYTMIFTVLLMFISLATFGQSTTKTLVKSFNVEGQEIVSIDIDAPVEVQKWSGKLLRIQLQISLETGSNALLKSLVQAGRYNLRHNLEDGSYSIYAPSLDMQVKVGGHPLQDDVSLIVYAPENITVVVPTNDAEEVAEEQPKSVN
jgi:hypothetical protein